MALVDGRAGIVVGPDGRLAAVILVGVDDGRVTAIDVVGSPDRLATIEIRPLDASGPHQVTRPLRQATATAAARSLTPSFR